MSTASDITCLLAYLSVKQKKDKTLGKNQCRAYSKLLKHIFGYKYRQLLQREFDSGALKRVRAYSTLASRSYTYVIGNIYTKETLERGRKLYKKARSYVHRHKPLVEKIVESLNTVLGKGKAVTKRGRIFNSMVSTEKSRRPEMYSADLKKSFYQIIALMSGDELLYQDIRDDIFSDLMDFEGPEDRNRLLFARNSWKWHPRWTNFQMFYPEAAEFVKNHLRKLGGSEFSIFLQSMEGKVMRRALELTLERAECPVIPTHDCLKTFSAADYVISRQSWAQAGNEILGAPLFSSSL